MLDCRFLGAHLETIPDERWYSRVTGTKVSIVGRRSMGQTCMAFRGITPRAPRNLSQIVIASFRGSVPRGSYARMGKLPNISGTVL